MVAQAEFRQILGRFATGVTVITTRDVGGEPRGFTANAFTSLSLDPPLVLVCVAQRSQTHQALQADGATFAVNILTHRQEGISRHFASTRPNKFERLAYRNGVTGAPILEDVLAHLECRVVDRLASGDHTIMIGEVLSLAAESTAPPLIFYGGAYTPVAADTCADAGTYTGESLCSLSS